MRSKVELTFLFLVLNLGFVLSQTVRAGSGSNSRTLPQWLTGIIAVVGFLFLTFVIFLIKRAWCEKSNRNNVNNMNQESTKENDYVAQIDHEFQRRTSRELKTFTNQAMDNSEDKVTAM
ncbi:hypothetical protein WMY93_024765 [Mugilogobius chulae]|uniref:Uncharacterized protein n=1 Tax=Mugilogobius chulae TaxID=88201 RepID=A0AAW0NAY7_9GOBI